MSGIEAADGPRWLVQDLWAEEGVGIVGGNPKCGKTWLAMDLALSVASGTAALERYPVVKPGPALIFAAEDRPPMVRARLVKFFLHLEETLGRSHMPMKVVTAVRQPEE